MFFPEANPHRIWMGAIDGECWVGQCTMVLLSGLLLADCEGRLGCTYCMCCLLASLMDE